GAVVLVFVAYTAAKAIQNEIKNGAKSLGQAVVNFLKTFNPISFINDIWTTFFKTIAGTDDTTADEKALGLTRNNDGTLTYTGDNGASFTVNPNADILDPLGTLTRNP